MNEIWLLRYVSGKPVELVAIVHDVAMATRWVANTPATERRGWASHEFGMFSSVQ